MSVLTAPSRVGVQDPFNRAASGGSSEANVRDLPAGTSKAAIQAVLNALGADGGGELVLGPGIFTNVDNLTIPSRVTLSGHGHCTEIRPTVGATGYMVSLAAVTTRDAMVRDMWINCNGHSLDGIVFTNTADGTSWCNRIDKVKVTNAGGTSCGIVMNSPVVWVTDCEVSSCYDCYVIGTNQTDGHFEGLQALAARRDGFHIEGHHNAFTCLKSGESARRNVYITGGGFTNTFDGVICDTDILYVAGEGHVYIDAANGLNVMNGLSFTRGTGIGVELAGTTRGNQVYGSGWSISAALTYAAKTSAGAVNNIVSLQTPADFTGPIDPASNIETNEITIDRCQFGRAVPVGGWVQSASFGGTDPSQLSAGLMAPLWRFSDIGDAIVGSFEVDPSWWGRKLIVSIVWDVNANISAAGNWLVQIAYSKGDLATGSLVTDTDESQNFTTTATFVSGRLIDTRFSMATAVATGDRVGFISVARNTGTTLTTEKMRLYKARVWPYA